MRHARLAERGGEAKAGGEREPLRRRSLVDLILARLREEILEGRYPPGSSLPPERELAARYGVNRTSVKHALMKLEQFGLIEIKHGIGSLVVDYSENGGAELLPHLLMGAGSIDRELLADLLEVRVMMGGAIAHLAARRADEAGTRLLASIVARAEEALGDPAAVQALDMAFFRALADATGNRALRLLLNSVAVAYLRSAADFVHAFRDTAAVLEGLRRVLAGVRAGDAERARAAAAAHLAANSERMLKAPARGRGGPRRGRPGRVRQPRE